MEIYKPNPVTGEMEVFESNPGDNLKYHVPPRYTNRQSINGPFSNTQNNSISKTTNNMIANQNVNPISNNEFIGNDPINEVMSLNDQIFGDPNINSLNPDDAPQPVVIDDALPLEFARNKIIEQPSMNAKESLNIGPIEGDYIDSDFSIVNEVINETSELPKVEGMLGHNDGVNPYEWIYPDGEMVLFPAGTLPQPQNKKPVEPKNKKKDYSSKYSNGGAFFLLNLQALNACHSPTSPKST